MKGTPFGTTSSQRRSGAETHSTLLSFGAGAEVGEVIQTVTGAETHRPVENLLCIICCVFPIWAPPPIDYFDKSKSPSGKIIELGTFPQTRSQITFFYISLYTYPGPLSGIQVANPPARFRRRDASDGSGSGRDLTKPRGLVKS